MLTAAEVEQKTFSTALRGYDLDEVDDFLDEIVATIRELTEQLEAAQTGAITSRLSSRAPLPGEQTVAGEPRKDADEGVIARALIAAQTAADKLLEDAREEAEKIVVGAKDEADTWEAERAAKRAEAQDEITALASRVASVRSELSVLAGEVSGKLDEMDEVIQDVELTGPEETPISETDADQSEEPEPKLGAHAGDGAGAPGSEQSTEASPDAGGHEQTAEASAEPGEGAEGADKLDDMLNGVANDLQMNTDNSESDSDED